MHGPDPIPVFRPSKLTDGPEFQGSLVESPANIFYQKVTASRATLNRIQFQWRSVSDNLLMSPTVMLRFRLKIRSPVVWNQVMQYIAVRGVRGPKAARTEAGMAPRCTGTWAAWAIISPWVLNTAQEKSRRSLMLGE